MPKRKKTKKSSPLAKIIALISIGGLAYFLGINHDTVKEVYQKKAPTVKSFVAEKTPVIKEATQNGLQRIADITSQGVQNLKERVQQPTNSDGSISDKRLSLDDDERLKISSFNIRIFSNNSRDDNELDHIVSVLQKYDIIAIQELRDELILKRTIAKLKEKGYNYKYLISPPVGRKVKEQYAFMYRPDKVNVTQNGRLYHDQYDEFIREPYYASFKSGNFDFTLVTIHALYGKNKAERRPEIIRLAHVYEQIQNENPSEQDIIVLGDFNFAANDDGFNHLKAIPSMTALIHKDQKTTITDTSSYDNFWFQNQHLTEYTGTFGIDRFDENLFNNDDRAAKLAVSDHRPVWAEFQRFGRDDD